MDKVTIQSKLPGPGVGGIIIEQDQDVFDIMSLITFAHEQQRTNYDKIAASFWTGDIYSTCENLFNFCKKNIRYEIQSEELQTVRSPQRIIAVGKGDCKHYASFIAGILDALKRQGKPINWCYRFASYQVLDDIPGHVFVVVDDNGQEIWIDPVLKTFDRHKWYWHAIDRKVKNKRMAGIGSVNRIGDNTGATIKQVGNTFIAVAPALNAIPVVGAVVSQALSIVGKVINVIGSLFPNWQNSTNVRWLTQNYEYYVLGHCNVSSDNHVDEQYVPAAQTWFSIALGVPIFDRYRWYAIKGWDMVHERSKGWTRDQRIKDYMSYPEAAGIPYDTVGHAVDISDAMLFTEPCGGWANIKPANVEIAQPAGTLLNSGGSSAATSSGSSNTGMYLLIGGIALLLISNKD